MTEKTAYDVMLEIASHYLMNGCDECDFLCISKTCDARPINCNWMKLYHYFKNAEEEQDGEKDGKDADMR